jgi:hypothetical protein
MYDKGVGLWNIGIYNTCLPIHSVATSSSSRDVTSSQTSNRKNKNEAE